MTAIQLDHLSKTFGTRKQPVYAVVDLDLEVQPGQVYGFLGPNGAGKTTTIRMLMALVHPTRGTARIFGRDVQKEPAVLKRVGALVEGPAFYAFLSGQENLEVLAHTAGDYRPERVAALLAQVGLAGSAGRKVGSYSMGMKQRLGIAAALLGDPDLVILDEPTNGLDPAGIQEMRQFIRDLVSQHGKIVFVSSHLLNEVEQICDRVAIIHQGRLLREGAVVELVAEKARLRIQAEPLEQAAAILQSHWSVEAVDSWLRVRAGAQDAPLILERLVTLGVRVFQVIYEHQSLEEYFMSVTRE